MEVNREGIRGRVLGWEDVVRVWVFGCGYCICDLRNCGIFAVCNGEYCICEYC